MRQVDHLGSIRTGRRTREFSTHWRLYLDSLANTPTAENLQAPHFQRRGELFVELVYEMGKYLGFDFDKVAIDRNSYIPVAHGEIEDDQRLIRKGVVELLTGKRALSTLSWLMPPQRPYPVQVSEVPAAPQPAQVEPPEQKQPLIEESKPVVPERRPSRG